MEDLPPNPYAKLCPSRQILDRIGDTWTVLIVLELNNGSRRFGELAKLIEGVSQKMLTQTLRGLERDGMVARTVHASVPPRVDYELTDLGRSMMGPIQALESWAKDHIEEVIEARCTHDASVG